MLVLLLRLPGLEWIPALGLGGCLWWVAQRQAGAQPAALALALLLGSPGLLRSGRAVLAAAGLVAVVYTALGVAHALQGPRRKWLPRIALMTVLVGFSAAVSPPACVLGLVLGMAAALYLADSRRRWIVGAAACWGGLAAVLHRFAVGGASLAVPRWISLAGLLLPLACAVCISVGSRRSRWFGNTLALLVLLASLCAAPWEGWRAVVWGLPFGLLWIAGTAADGLEGKHGRALSVTLWTLASFQFIFSFV